MSGGGGTVSCALAPEEEVVAVVVALYRKYRPRTFAELIGQEHVTEPLSQALRSGRLHHAYLFSGPRGCGKTSSARVLARSLNCDTGPTPDPCGTCEPCRALAADGPGSVDVIEIDAASHGGVDDARDLRERAFFTPVAGRYKIYVIDEAHMVSSAGFNALLKLVEEPPDYVKFVFATTEPEKVLPTIKSRTHHYPFRLVPPGVLRAYLERLCTAEEVAVEPAVFPLVVRAGGGSVRDTLSVLDQLLAGADPERGITYERAVALLGVTDAALLDEVVDALAAGDGAGMFAGVDRVIEAGHDPRRFAADLLERLRDLIVLRQVPAAVEKGLLDAPADTLSRMETQSSLLGPGTLTRCAEVVHSGLVEMRGTTSPRLLLELVCARMLLPDADESEGSLWQRLERMERRLGAAAPETAAAEPPPPTGAGASARAAPTEAGAAAAEAAPAEPAAGQEHTPGSAAEQAPAPEAGGTETGVLDAAAVRRVWDEVVTTVGRRSKRAAAVAREAAVRDVEGDTVVLLFQHRVHATMLDDAPQPVLDALHEVLGGTWRLRCVSRDAAPRKDAPVSQRAPTGPTSTGSPPDTGAAASASSDTGSAIDRPAAAGESGDADPAGVAESDASSGAAAEPDWPEPARPGGGAAHTGGDEQEALELLRRTLGAEAIGEVAP